MQSTAASNGGIFNVDAVIRLAGLESFVDCEPSTKDISTVLDEMEVGRCPGLDEQPARGGVESASTDYIATSSKDVVPDDELDNRPGEQLAAGGVECDGAGDIGVKADDAKAEQPAAAAPTIASRSLRDSEPDWDDLWASRDKDLILERTIEEVSASPIPILTIASPSAWPPTLHHGGASVPRFPPSPSSGEKDASGRPVEAMGPAQVTPPASGGSQPPSLVENTSSCASTTTGSPSTLTPITSIGNSHEGEDAPAEPDHDNALPRRLDKGLSGEALVLATKIATQAGVPVDALLAVILGLQPTKLAREGSLARNNDVEESGAMVPQSRSAAVPLDDAFLAQFGAGISSESLALAESIAAQVGKPGSTSLSAMISSQPWEGNVPRRLLKRGWDDEGTAHATSKRAKGVKVLQQAQSTARHSEVAIPDFTADRLSDLCEKNPMPHGREMGSLFQSNIAGAYRTIQDIAPTGQMDYTDEAQFAGGWADADADIDDMYLAPQGPSSNAEEQENDVSLQQQGAPQASATAPAGLGHAQTHKKIKSSLGVAVERNGRDPGRLLVEAQIAVRILERPDEPLPNALPPTVAGWFKEDLRVLMGLPPGPSTVCEACFKAGHRACGYECVIACCVCGCPVARGDWTQFHRHRIRKCPGWCAIVAAGRHKEWLEQNGLMDELGEEDGVLYLMQKQIFCEHTRSYAKAAAARATEDKDRVRRKALLDCLDKKELDDLKEEMKESNPFAMVPSLKNAAVIERLRAELRADDSSSSS